jgi:hypothetical protein
VRLVWPDHLDPHARCRHPLAEISAQRRPRFVDLPTGPGQHLLHQCAHRCFDGHSPGWQHATLRVGDVGGQLPRQLIVLLSSWRHREPQQLRAVEQPDGEKLAVSTPGPDRGGGRLCTESPEPTQVSRMKLERR